MNLLEFVAYCKLAGWITHSLQTGQYTHKVVIKRKGLVLELLYSTDIVGEGRIIKSAIYNVSGASHLKPALDTILKMFFPSN